MCDEQRREAAGLALQQILASKPDWLADLLLPTPGRGFVCMNYEDGNEWYSLESERLVDAMGEALEELGYFITTEEVEEVEAHKAHDHASDEDCAECRAAGHVPPQEERSNGAAKLMQIHAPDLSRPEGTA